MWSSFHGRRAVAELKRRPSWRTRQGPSCFPRSKGGRGQKIEDMRDASGRPFAKRRTDRRPSGRGDDVRDRRSPARVSRCLAPEVASETGPLAPNELSLTGSIRSASFCESSQLAVGQLLSSHGGLPKPGAMPRSRIQMGTSIFRKVVSPRGSCQFPAATVPAASGPAHEHS